MEFKKWKKTITVILSVSIITIAAIAVSHSAGTTATDVTYDFEVGTTPEWSCFYGNVNKTIETEENGNKYLKLSYNGNYGKERSYFDVKVMDIDEDTKGTLLAEYDVMYPMMNTERDGEIQFKKRIASGSDQTWLVARVAKENGKLRWQNSSKGWYSLETLDESDLMIEESHWYSVKLVVDLDNGKQTILIFDRDTQELLSYLDREDTIGYNSTMNMITFSSGTDMCIDNLKIYYSTACDWMIYGDAHVSSNADSRYYLLGKDPKNNITAIETDTSVKWALDTEKYGIGIDSNTGQINVHSNPEPGPIVINAIVNGVDVIPFLVNVSK